MVLFASNFAFGPRDFLPQFSDVSLQFGNSERIEWRRHQAGLRPRQFFFGQPTLLLQ